MPSYIKTLHEIFFNRKNIENSPENFSLSEIQRAFKYIERKENNKKLTIQILGTNGKGTVAHCLSKILNLNGYKTGLFTSPHLISPRERISVGNNPISTKDLKDIYTNLKKLPNINNLSTFEILTLIAYIYFSNQRTDIDIYEAGLGGKLDATSIFNHKLYIITHISVDHTNFLGEDLSSITKEKIYHIKNIVITTYHQREIVLRLIKEKVLSRNGKLFLAPLKDGNILSERINSGIIEKTLNILKKEFNFNISNNIKKCTPPCRIEKIGNIILDGSHNTEAIKNLVSYLREDKSSKYIIFFGAMKDKKIDKMLKEITKLTKQIDTLYLVSLPFKRFEDNYSKYGRILSEAKIAYKEINKTQFINTLKKTKKERRKIVICGSFILCSKAKLTIGNYALENMG